MHLNLNKTDGIHGEKVRTGTPYVHALYKSFLVLLAIKFKIAKMEKKMLNIW